MSPRPTPRSSRDDRGFTLLELLIAISVLGLVMGAIVSGFVVSIQATRSTNTRLDESHDVRLVNSTFSQDVAGGNLFAAGSAPRCGSDPAANVVLEILGGTFDPRALPSAVPTATPLPTVWPQQALVTYVTRPVTVDGTPATELHRLTCTTAPKAVPDGDQVVARRLSATSPPAARCYRADDTSVGCGSSLAVTVRMAVTPLSRGTALVTLVAHRRTS